MMLRARRLLKAMAHSTFGYGGLNLPALGREHTAANRRCRPEPVLHGVLRDPSRRTFGLIGNERTYRSQTKEMGEAVSGGCSSQRGQRPESSYSTYGVRM